MKQKPIIVLVLVILFMCNLIYCIYQLYIVSIYEKDVVNDVYVTKIDREIFLNDLYFFQMKDRVDTLKMSNFIETGPCLVLRIPRVSCQECKFTELENINQFYQNNEEINLLVILTGTYKELRFLQNEYNYNYPKVSTSSSFFFDSIFNIPDRPFYFILDTNFRAHSFFYPSNQEKNKTQEFYEYVDKYFDTKLTPIPSDANLKLVP